MLKVYLDGSGNFDDPLSRFLTLAALFADDSVWASIEEQWKAVLEKHHVPYLHMKEMLRGDSPFSRWDDLKKQEFVRDLYNALPIENRSTFLRQASLSNSASIAELPTVEKT